MKKQFITKAFAPASLAVIQEANRIIVEYQRQGFTLTLRQLYYQFVSRNLIANKQSEYKRLGKIISNGRLAGLIDWDALEDRTRNLETHAFWSSPESIIQSAAQGYAENLWASQDFYVEAWIEKDALTGVIEPVCTEFRVPYFSCRGYASQSELFTAGERLKRQRVRGKRALVLHLGDHDPSGIDMTRDIEARLSMFADGWDVEVRRLALNFDQVEQYDPPPNPLKEKADGSLSDSRGNDYAEQFGDSSWELDALEPTVISDLIRTEIEGELDREGWDAALVQENDNRSVLDDIASRFDEVRDFLASEGDT